MSKPLSEYERELEEALSCLDEVTKIRVRADQVVGHEYFDDEDERHQALRKAVEAARELKAAKIRRVA